METIVEIKFGSHLYGTATPESDTDFKAVHVPPAEEILLGRVRHVISSKTKPAGVVKNTPEDTDRESYSVQRFLGLCAEGQTVAMDMLFAPREMMLHAPALLWEDIRAERHRLLSRKVAGFLGYCRTQANKYGIKGSRVAVARSALAFGQSMAEKHGATAKLGEAEIEIERFARDREHVQVIEIEQPGDRLTKHLEICNRKAPFTASIKNLVGIAERLVAEYGERALKAERNEGIDWKALSHAVRVGRQALELLDTGEIVFPRPEAAHLLAVKRGDLPYKLVAEEIEDLLRDLEVASDRSQLPEQPDFRWINDFVKRVHQGVVCSDRGG